MWSHSNIFFKAVSAYVGFTYCQTTVAAGMPRKFLYTHIKNKEQKKATKLAEVRISVIE